MSTDLAITVLLEIRRLVQEAVPWPLSLVQTGLCLNLIVTGIRSTPRLEMMHLKLRSVLQVHRSLNATRAARTGLEVLSVSKIFRFYCVFGLALVDLALESEKKPSTIFPPPCSPSSRVHLPTLGPGEVWWRLSPGCLA